uniref:hypothetical protein n=1 Tax=Klebsiella pneumoniae TaxID=573 RepID=UPI0013D21E23
YQGGHERVVQIDDRILASRPYDYLVPAIQATGRDEQVRFRHNLSRERRCAVRQIHLPQLDAAD